MPQLASDRPRLLLLDGHSLAYRAFFALPVENFATTTGQPTNAVYGFTSMLINVLRDEQPTHVAVAFDVSRQTFRLEQYSEYKAKRNKTPDEFRSQLPLIEQVLSSFSIPFLKVDGFEADDIIATLVTKALADGGDGTDEVGHENREDPGRSELHDGGDPHGRSDQGRPEGQGGDGDGQGRRIGRI